MKVVIPATEEQQRRVAIAEGLTQVRLEGMEPHPLFFSLAERYIQGEITLDEALELLSEALHVRS